MCPKIILKPRILNFMARLPITINIHFNKCVVNTPVVVSASASVIFFYRMLIWHKEMLLFVEEMEITAELTFCGNFFTKKHDPNIRYQNLFQN